MFSYKCRLSYGSMEIFLASLAPKTVWSCIPLTSAVQSQLCCGGVAEQVGADRPDK